jgi:putative transcriptional regulator
MMMSNKVKALSPLEAIHQTASGLYDAGIFDGETMRNYDVLCTPVVPKLNADDIKKLRLKYKVSQPVFAKLLNVSPSTIKQWELGNKHPQGASLKLLHLVSMAGIDLLRH